MLKSGHVKGVAAKKLAPTSDPPLINNNKFKDYTTLERCNHGTGSDQNRKRAS